MEKSNKKKFSIFIPSFGEPIPEEVVKMAEKISTLLNKFIPDEDKDLPDLPEKMTCFRDSLSFVKELSSTTIIKIQKFIDAITEFLANPPDKKVNDEDFIKLIVATNSALFSIDGFDTILRHLSEGFMPLAFDVVGGAEITFEELLDTNRTDT
ncbi:hypothetical protein IKG45_01425 [Candidatus Saccharibacteria bacterium]|nr:hypothetical protein [Candidatus Saccharibacteria bacterium]